MPFVLDADGVAGSKPGSIWDDLKTLFPDVMNESQVLFLGVPMSYILPDTESGATAST